MRRRKKVTYTFFSIAWAIEIQQHLGEILKTVTLGNIIYKLHLIFFKKPR